MALRPAHWPRQALIGLVQAYRYLLKPWLGNACRFEPTCSAYALVALQQHGAARGSLLTGWRLLRCHPWCAGGCDPVPAHFTFKRQPVAGAASFPDSPTDPSRTLP